MTNSGSADRAAAGGSPSFPGPDLDSGSRGQDRRSSAGHRRRRHQLPHRRPPRLLRRPHPDHEVVGHLDPRRTRTPRRQPATRTGDVPVRVRRPAPSRLPQLLRPLPRRLTTLQPGRGEVEEVRGAVRANGSSGLCRAGRTATGAGPNRLSRGHSRPARRTAVRMRLGRLDRDPFLFRAVSVLS